VFDFRSRDEDGKNAVDGFDAVSGRYEVAIVAGYFEVVLRLAAAGEAFGVCEPDAEGLAFSSGTKECGRGVI